MKRQRLHLVDENNDPVSSAIQSAVEAAHYWAVREFPPYRPGANRELGGTLGEEHGKQGFARLGSTPSTYGNARNRAPLAKDQTSKRIGSWPGSRTRKHCRTAGKDLMERLTEGFFLNS